MKCEESLKELSLVRLEKDGKGGEMPSPKREIVLTYVALAVALSPARRKAAKCTPCHQGGERIISMIKLQGKFRLNARRKKSPT